MPQHLPNRIRVIHEAGVWKHWTDLAKQEIQNTNANNELVAARMDGNVVLILLVWICGLAGSLTGIALEFSCHLLPKFRFS